MNGSWAMRQGYGRSRPHHETRRGDAVLVLVLMAQRTVLRVDVSLIGRPRSAVASRRRHAMDVYWTGRCERAAARSRTGRHLELVSGELVPEAPVSGARASGQLGATVTVLGRVAVDDGERPQHEMNPSAHHGLALRGSPRGATSASASTTSPKRCGRPDRRSPTARRSTSLPRNFVTRSNPTAPRALCTCHRFAATPMPTSSGSTWNASTRDCSSRWCASGSRPCRRVAPMTQPPTFASPSPSGARRARHPT